MRTGTKKCIVLLLAILLLGLCVWRLMPRTFEQMTSADPKTISSLSGTAVLGGNRDGAPYMEAIRSQLRQRRTTKSVKTFFRFSAGAGTGRISAISCLGLWTQPGAIMPMTAGALRSSSFGLHLRTRRAALS